MFMFVLDYILIVIPMVKVTRARVGVGVVMVCWTVFVDIFKDGFRISIWWVKFYIMFRYVDTLWTWIPWVSYFIGHHKIILIILLLLLLLLMTMIMTMTMLMTTIPILLLLVILILVLLLLMLLMSLSLFLLLKNIFSNSINKFKVIYVLLLKAPLSYSK